MKIAVLKTGAKQYIVEEGLRLKIEKIKGDYKIGDKIVFNDVLLNVNNDDIKIGNPNTGSKIEAELIKIAKYPTVEVVKYMPKSRYYKKNGHRQPYFEVQIKTIS